jgi:methyl-accepting chemotaxis protein
MKLDRKDTNYIIGILVVLLICTLSVDLSGFKNFPKYLSFGANLSSLILSILAIIYAFNQSQEATRQNERVQDGLADINAKISSLLKIQDELIAIKENINNQIIELSSSVRDFREISDSVQNIVNQLQENNGTISDELKKELKEVIKKIDKYEDKKSISFVTPRHSSVSSNIEPYLDFSGNIDINNIYSGLGKKEPSMFKIINTEEEKNQ